MTKISFSRGSTCQRLRLCGHATGSERVCAAVSGIVYSLLGYLANQEEESQSTMESGYAAIQAGRSPALDAAFDTAVIGLAQIAKAEPDYVHVTIRAFGGKRPG